MPLYAKKRWGTVSAGFPDERPFECPGKQDPGIPPGDDWRYDEILTLAGKEYYDTPLSKYYRKGYNLFIKLRDYKEDVLFFLRHTNVDFTNNKAERGCRKPKRHQAVSGTFRGNTNHSGEEYCDAMGVLQTMRAEGGNLYEKVKAVFQRIYPQKEKQGPQTC